MSTLRFSLAVAAILAMAAPVRLAVGQITNGSSNGNHSGPFIEPDTFQPDFQFFAPADVTDYEQGRDVEPNTGFFFTFERLYINVTRPRSRFPVFDSTAPPNETAPNDRQSFVNDSVNFWDGDFTWGNRIELGFMDCDDAGWTLVGWHIDGPNAQQTIINGDRLMGPDTDADPDPPSGGTYDFQNIGGFAPTGTTDLPIRQSENLAKMSSFEITKILERQYFHNGGVFEPLVGVRYIQFRDRFRNSTYFRIESDPDPLAVVDDLEYYRDEQNGFENNMLGPQLGFRMHKETGHWKLNSEFRMFGMQNWQHYHTMVDHYIWNADTPARVDPERTPAYARQERHISYSNQSEFVWGGELKLDAAYQVTRDISIRTGFAFIDLGRGVGRGRDLTFNDQAVQMFGASFGIDINR